MCVPALGACVPALGACVCTLCRPLCYDGYYFIPLQAIMLSSAPLACLLWLQVGMVELPNDVCLVMVPIERGAPGRRQVWCYFHTVATLRVAADMIFWRGALGAVFDLDLTLGEFLLVLVRGNPAARAPEKFILTIRTDSPVSESCCTRVQKPKIITKKLKSDQLELGVKW